MATADTIEMSAGDLDASINALLAEGRRTPQSWRSVRYGIRNWSAWCDRLGYSPEVPVPPRQLGHYVVCFVYPGLYDPGRGRIEPYTAGSINSAVLAVRALHEAVGMPSPTEDPFVQSVIQGGKRIGAAFHGPPNKRHPITPEDLRIVLAVPSPDGEVDAFRWTRDRAWILTSWHGALRWQDWAPLRWGTTMRRMSWGWQLTLGTGKTRIGTGAESVAVLPADDPALCPVAALDAWAQAAEWKHDTVVFRSEPSNGRSVERPLTAEAATSAVVGMYERAGLSTAVLGVNSARRGFAITASRHGKDPMWIMAGGRWRSLRSAVGYTREAGGQARAKLRQQRLAGGAA